MTFVAKCFYAVLFSLIIALFIAYSPVLVDVDPQPVRNFKYKELSGALAKNIELDRLEKLFEGEISGPESVAYYEGKIYSGLKDGRIVAFSGRNIENVSLPSQACSGPWETHLCGRVLGIRITSTGIMFAADKINGLIKVNIETGIREVLVKTGTIINGKPITFLNDLTIDEDDGVLYISDASTKWGKGGMVLIMMEMMKTGRILKYNLRTAEISELVNGFVMANGIQLSYNKQSLLLSDTGLSTVFRYYIKGHKKGTKDIFIDKLPGYTDNIRPSISGGYWIPFAVFKDPGKSNLYDKLHSLPLVVRKVIFRVMVAISDGAQFVSSQILYSKYLKNMANFVVNYGYFHLLNEPEHGLIIEVDKDGNIRRSLYASADKMMYISQVLELPNSDLYLASFSHNFFAYLAAK